MKYKIAAYIALFLTLSITLASCREDEYVWQGNVNTGEWEADVKIEAGRLFFLRDAASVYVDFVCDRNATYCAIELDDGNWNSLTGPEAVFHTSSTTTIDLQSYDVDAIKRDGLLVKGCNLRITKIIVKNRSRIQPNDSISGIKNENTIFSGEKNFGKWEDYLTFDTPSNRNLAAGSEIIVDFVVNPGQAYGQILLKGASWEAMEQTVKTASNHNEYNCYTHEVTSTTFTIAETEAATVSEGFVLSGENVTIKKVTVIRK